MAWIVGCSPCMEAFAEPEFILYSRNASLADEEALVRAARSCFYAFEKALGTGQHRQRRPG